MIIVLSSIAIAVISAQVITFYHDTSTKVIGAQCDKTRKICQIRSMTTYFGYFHAYSLYYVPFPLLGMVYPHTFISNPNICDNCLSKITPQDEKQVLNSKTPVPQSDLPSEQPSPPPSGSSPSESPPSGGSFRGGGGGGVSGDEE